MRRRRLLATLFLLAALPPLPAAGTENRPQAPELMVERWYQSDGPLTLEDLRGKAVLLNFWGLWCPPCVEALPDLTRIVDTYRDRDLVVIGVHTPARADELEAFLQQHAVPFPVGVDSDKTAQRYQLRNYPTYVLIDRLGRIHWRGVELPDDGTIDELLAVGR